MSVTAFVECVERGITDAEFVRFQKLMLDEAGIRLNDTKKALLVGRLSRRLRELGLDSFGQYYAHVTDPAQNVELVRMLDLVSTNETHFFREPKQFEFIEDELVPAWRDSRREHRLTIWSAGCSTGEEPYSIAMLLHSHFPDWTIDILATDLSTRVLQRAMNGIWKMEKAREIPPEFLRRYMLRGVGTQRGTMKIHPDLRSMIRFHRVNLNDAVYATGGPFDLIFCRNVLIYFDASVRARVVHRLIDSLTPGGHLFLGHAETLNGFTPRVSAVRPTIWTRR